jgi:uncharacterized protein (TIGR03083 family)
MQTPAPERPDFSAVVAAMRREYEMLNRHLAALRPQHWAEPGACGSWSVQDVVRHLGEEAETRLILLKYKLDEAGTERPTRERYQVIWDYFASLTPEPLYAAFRDRNETYLAYVEALPIEKQQQRVRFSPGEAPPQLGEVPLGEYLQSRLSELALHSWDIRVVLEPTARLLPDTTRTLLASILDLVDFELPADVRARLAGTTYAFVLSGAVEREVILVVETDRVALADRAVSGATATLQLPAEAFIRLLLGRLPLPAAAAAGEVAVEGDRNAAMDLNALYRGF